MGNQRDDFRADCHSRRCTGVTRGGLTGCVSQPITVAVERHVDPARIAEATIWTQAGADLAGHQPGYLPFVTRALQPWLQQPQRPAKRA